MKKVLLLTLCIIYGVLFYIGFEQKSNNIVVNTKDDLYLKIEEFAKNNKMDKIESRFDHIYKRIPGLNGIEVDIPKSYEKMKLNGNFDEKKVIYKQIPIEKTIDKLNTGPIYQGNKSKNMVTININLSWGEEYVLDMLDILNDYNVKVNFYVEGKLANKNVDLIKKINSEGHLIGNHSYSHGDFKVLDKKNQREEINKTNNILMNIINKKITYFSPPSGGFNQTTLDLMDETNMNLILWNVDTIDWQKPSTNVIIDRVLNKVEAGSIILMHPTKNTLEALESIIIGIQKKGLKINTIEELISPINNNYN